ncbi:MAG: hypothetical protein ABI895_37505 [Deltaproteobacteria bacterium]
MSVLLSNAHGDALARRTLRRLIGGTPPPDPVTAAPFVHALNECHLASWLIDELEQLRRDPTASVALICRVPSTARRLHAALRVVRRVSRLVRGGTRRAGGCS